MNKNNKNRLYNYGQVLLTTIEMFIKEVEEAQMTNEQFFLDWEDKLNELSTKDHNVSPN